MRRDPLPPAPTYCTHKAAALSVILSGLLNMPAKFRQTVDGLNALVEALTGSNPHARLNIDALNALVDYFSTHGFSVANSSATAVPMHLDFSGGSLDLPTITTILAFIVSIRAVLVPGVINFSGGTSAALAGAALPYRTTLIGDGWTIISNP